MWVPHVRVVWVLIMSLGNSIIWVKVDGWIQNVEVIVIMKVRFSIQNIGEGKELNNDVVDGSNDEKMSVSIKT